MPETITFNPSKNKQLLDHLRGKRPLVHCLTNSVVQNFTANVLLAIGASPAMVTAIEEVAHFVPVADSLLINIGTVTAESAQTMLLAAKTAHREGTPWVLDPVAVGAALPYRTEIAQQLLLFKPQVIRGNASEILVLAGEPSMSKGADSLDSSEKAQYAAEKLAKLQQTVVAVTGEVDYITNGELTYSVAGGDIALTQVTGTGCSLSAIVAALIACSTDHLSATAMACFFMSYAGGLADKSKGMGTYAGTLLDLLSDVQCE